MALSRRKIAPSRATDVTNRAPFIYCRFETPGEPVAVRFRADALHDLSRQVQRATASSREVAGFLFGSDPLSAKAASIIVAIDGYAALRQHVENGPLFSYSSTHAAILNEELRFHQAKFPVCGFFRSNLRWPDLRPSEDDLRLMRDHFGPGSVLLLLDGSAKEIGGRLYSLGEPGTELRRSFPIFGRALGYVETASDNVSTVPAAASTVTSAASTVPLAASTDEGRTFPPRDHPVETLKPARMPASVSIAWIGLFLAAVAVIILGTLQYRTIKLLDRSQAVVPPAGLALKSVRYGDNQWRLSWSPTAAAIQTAAKGHVSILDGYLRKEFDLTAGELQNGSIVYMPAGDDVSFRLEVFDLQSGRSMSESIRVLANAWPDPVARAYESASRNYSSAESYSAPAATPRLYRNQPNTETSPPTDSIFDRNRPATGGAIASAPPPPREPTRTFRPPEPVIVSRSINDVPIRPEPAVSMTPQPMAPLPWRVEPPRPLPVKPETPAPPSTGHGVTASTAPGLSSAGGKVEVDPPVLLYKTDPQYPKLASAIHAGGVVRVKATVGTDGLLYNPEITSGSLVLRSAVFEALKHWKYKPATINGRPVSAPAILEIRFASRN